MLFGSLPGLMSIPTLVGQVRIPHLMPQLTEEISLLLYYHPYRWIKVFETKPKSLPLGPFALHWLKILIDPDVILPSVDQGCSRLPPGRRSHARVGIYLLHRLDLADQFFHIPSHGRVHELNGSHDPIGIDDETPSMILPRFLLIDPVGPGDLPVRV